MEANLRKMENFAITSSAIKMRILMGPTQSAAITNKIIHVECLSQCLAYNSTSKNGAFYN